MLFARNDSGICHFEWVRRAKNPHFDFMDTSLSYESSVWQGFCHCEWVKRATQRVARRSRSKKIHIVILSVSEISTEFKTHFEFKVKKRLKYANSRSYFMDTSLSYESSVWQSKLVWQGFCHFEPLQKGKNLKHLSFWA